MRPALTATPLAAALAWVVALLADADPFGQASALLIGIGLVGTAVVAVVGMILTGGRWAHRLGVASIILGVGLAAARPIDAFWVAGLVVSAVALSTVYTPFVTSGIRRLPAAAGPPPASVAAPVLLLAAPYLLGVASPGGAPWAMLVVGLGAPLTAFLFSRVVPGGLLAIRLGWPLAAIGLAAPIGLPGGLVSAALGVGVAAIAWRPEVRASFHPPVERGSAYAIPPELTPGEILNAARIDDRGRPS